MKLIPLGANQNEVELGNGVTVFFSYKTPVAYHKEGEGYYRTEQYYSRTTSKHINKWLCGSHANKVPQEQIDNLVK